MSRQPTNKTPPAAPSAITPVGKSIEVTNRKANDSGIKPGTKSTVVAQSEKMPSPSGRAGRNGLNSAAENKAINPIGGAPLSNEANNSSVSVPAKDLIALVGKSTEVNNRKAKDHGAGTKPAAIVTFSTPDKKPLPSSGGAVAELSAPFMSAKSAVATAIPQASPIMAAKTIDPTDSPILNFLTTLFDQLSDPTEVMRCFQYLVDGEWPSCIRLAESIIVSKVYDSGFQVKSFIMALALSQGEYFAEADLNFLVLKTSSWPIGLLTFVDSVSKLHKAESPVDVAEGQAGLRSVRQEVTKAFQSMEKTQILKMKQRLCGFFEYLGKNNLAMTMETMWKKLIDDLEKAYNEAEKRSKPLVHSSKASPWSVCDDVVGVRKVLVLGGSGAGKSTFINALHNYFHGIDLNRMEKPIAAESKSQAVSQTRTCATFSFQSPNRSVKFDVIDTPGLADTKGMAQDQQNVDMILEAAKNAGSLNAVLLVVNGRVPRRDLAFRSVIAQLKAYLPNDIQKRIVLVYTNSESARDCLAKDSVSSLNIHVHKDHTFYIDNSAFSKEYKTLTNKAEKENLERQWNTASSTLSDIVDCVAHFPTTSTKSFDLIIKERGKLKAILHDVRMKIKNLQSLQEQIEAAQEQVKKGVDQQNQFSKFHQTHQITETVLVDVPYHSTLCDSCNHVCHSNCQLNEIKQKGSNGFIGCAAFAGSSCQICPGRCLYSTHYHARKAIVTRTKYVTDIMQDVKSKYDAAIGSTKAAQLDFSTAASAKTSVDAAIKIEIQKLHDSCKEIMSRCSGFNLVNELFVMIAQMEKEAGFLTNFTARADADKNITTIKKIAEELSNVYVKQQSADADKPAASAPSKPAALPPTKPPATSVDDNDGSFYFHESVPEIIRADVYDQLVDIIGMRDVKESINNLIISAQVEVQKAKVFNRPVHHAGFGHFIFKGNPGTGKSMIADLLPLILEDIKKYLGKQSTIDKPKNDSSSKKPAAAQPTTPPGMPDPKVPLDAYRSSRKSLQASVTQNLLLLKSELRKLPPEVIRAAATLSPQGKDTVGVGATVTYLVNKVEQDIDNLKAALDADSTNFTSTATQLDAMISTLQAQIPPPPQSVSSNVNSPNTIQPLVVHKTTGAKLLQLGKDEFKDILSTLTANGVLFIDEAYQLRPDRDQRGAGITDLIMDAMEVHAKTFSVIIAGYEDEIDKFLSFNRGMSGRFPQSNIFLFRNYSEEELKVLYKYFAEKEYYVLESELSLSIWSKRNAKAASLPSFANGRLVREAVRDAINRHTSRLMSVRNMRAYFLKNGLKLSFGDVLGGCSLSQLKGGYVPIQQLDQYVGAAQAKARMMEVLTSIVSGFLSEISGGKVMDISYHQCFYGNPGTGKTTFARVFAKILGDMGLVSKRDIYETTPTDIKGEAVGVSEANVQRMFDMADGKVLFIDEAYLFYDNSPYSVDMMNALVSQIQPNPLFRPIVIMAGYEDKMEEMFLKANPGLRRRVGLNPPFRFNDFTEGEMSIILKRLIARNTDMKISRQVVQHAVSILEGEKQRPNFGNAGAVETLVSKAVSRASGDASRRQGRKQIELKKEDFGEITRTLKFSYEKLKQHSSLRKWYDSKSSQIRRKRERGITPKDEILYFLLLGKPGTGKTSSARLLGILNNLGLLHGDNFHEVSVSSLTGQYVGQAEQKTREMFDAALGGVLFIDEAYRLGDSQYGLQVLNEMVDMATKTKYMGKMCVVLAGYPLETRMMLNHNPGALGRFGDNIIEIADPSVKQLCEHFWNTITAESLSKLVSKEAIGEPLEKVMSYLVERCSPNWAFYRDVETYLRRCDSIVTKRAWTEKDLWDVAKKFVDFKGGSNEDKQVDSATSGGGGGGSAVPQSSKTPPPPPPPPLEPKCQTATATPNKSVVAQKSEINTSQKPAAIDTKAATTDASADGPTWNTRQESKAVEPDSTTSCIIAVALDRAVNDGVLSKKEAEAIVKTAVDNASQQASAWEKLPAKFKTFVISKAEFNLDQNTFADALKSLQSRIVQQELSNQQVREQVAKNRLEMLKRIGRCCMNYPWMSLGNGRYQCLGGSHFCTDAEIDAVS